MAADYMLIAQTLGVSAQFLASGLQVYSAFRKSNVELFFRKLLESEKDLSEIGKNEDLQRHFLSTIDKVSNEANQEKIEYWKNALVHLATDFKDFNFNDNLLRTLDQLTVFDLVVLTKIYSTKYETDNFDKMNESVIRPLVQKGAPEPIVFQSINLLFAHHLVDELSTYGTFSIGRRNELGAMFLKYISEDFEQDL